MEVISGAKVIGVQIHDPSTSVNGIPHIEKLFKVTYQSSVAGVANEDKEGKVLKSKRSSLYEGLESLSNAEQEQDMMDSESDIITSRREKVTHSIECDRVIMATGSSRLGYDMVRGLGHSMQDPLPSLFSFKIPVSGSQ